MKMKHCDGQWKKIGLTFLFLLFLVPGAVLANEDQRKISLALDQTVFSLAGKLGSEKFLEINVSNLADRKQTVSLAINNLTLEENNRLSSFGGEDSLFGMKDWISAEEKVWILEPKETKKITLKVNVPKDAAVGSHYAGVFFRATPEIQGENFQTVMVEAQVGAYVLLNVDGTVTGSGKIESFWAPLIVKARTDLRVEFENTGNIHYIPYGEIDVKNLFSQRTEKIELEKHFVFPGKKYTFEDNWQGGSDWGVYSAKAYFVDGNMTGHFSRRWIVGKYSFLWLLALGGLFFIFRKIKRGGSRRRREEELRREKNVPPRFTRKV